MRKFLPLLAASTALAACASNGASPAEVREQTATVATAAEGPVAPPDADRPQIGHFGFDEAGMDRSVMPGGSFYRYANGTWAKDTPIPADRSNYGMFTMPDQLSRQRTREILDEVKDNSDSKIGSAYAAYLDEAGIEARGLAPIEPWLNQIRGLKS